MPERVYVVKSHITGGKDLLRVGVGHTAQGVRFGYRTRRVYLVKSHMTGGAIGASRTSQGVRFVTGIGVCCEITHHRVYVLTQHIIASGCVYCEINKS